MIGSKPLAEYQAMSLEEMRCAILPQLFELLGWPDPLGEDVETKIWPNETMEIHDEDCPSDRFYLTREGHVFTKWSKKFDSPSDEVKRVVK